MVRSVFQLQVIRAAAALAVVVFHAQGELRQRGFSDPFPNLSVGAFGVDLFFVVSGFIMVIASDRLFGRRDAAATFLSKRLLRVAPLYWLFTAVFAVVVIWRGRQPGHLPTAASDVVASFLFLPPRHPVDGTDFPIYSVGWTLNYEMFFYVCFSLTLALGRVRAVAALSAGLVALVAAGRVADLPWPLAYWSKPIVLEFAYGLWLGLAHRAGWRLPARGVPVLWAAAAAGVLLYLPHVGADADWRGFAWGLPAVAVVAGALAIRTPGTSRPARAATRLGDASYSLYLVHPLLFLVVFDGLSKVVDLHRLPAPVYALLLVAGSVTAALVLFRLVEAPMTRILQGAARARARWRRAEPTLAR